MWATLLYIALVVCGGALLTGLAATVLPRQPQRWWRTALATAVASGVLNFVVAARTPSVLYRDVATVAFIAMLCPVAVATIVWYLRERPWSERVWGGVAVTIAFFIVAPFALLFAHCTRGHCL